MCYQLLSFFLLQGSEENYVLVKLWFNIISYCISSWFDDVYLFCLRHFVLDSTYMLHTVLSTLTIVKFMKVQLCRFLLKYYYVQQIVCLNFIFCIKNFIIIINNVIVESLGDNFFWGFILWKIGATWIIFCAVSFLFITCLKTFYKNQQYITLYISHFQTKWIKKPWLLVFSLYVHNV